MTSAATARRPSSMWVRRACTGGCGVTVMAGVSLSGGFGGSGGLGASGGGVGSGGFATASGGGDGGEEDGEDEDDDEDDDVPAERGGGWRGGGGGGGTGRRGCAVSASAAVNDSTSTTASQLSPSTRRVSPSPGPSIIRSSPRTFFPARVRCTPRRTASSPGAARRARFMRSSRPLKNASALEQPAGASNSTRMATPSPAGAADGAATASKADRPRGRFRGKSPTT